MERAVLKRAKELEDLIDKLDSIKPEHDIDDTFIYFYGDILKNCEPIRIRISYKPLIYKILDFLKREKIELEKELLEL